MAQADYDDLVVKAAESFRLDANLMRAFVAVESGWNPWKNRYEPAYQYLVNPSDYAHKLFISLDTETMNQKTSFGLGQLMGGLCRDLGFQSDLLMLCEASINLFYMGKFLRRLSDKYGDEPDVVSAYNAGSPRKIATGSYVNQTYVDKIYAVLRDFRKLV